MTILSEEQVIKRKELVKLLKESIEIVVKYIKHFESEQSTQNELLLSDLKMGLRNLEAGVRLITTNEQWFKNKIETPSIKRGGFGGLSRGFGEFLCAIEEDWIDEILDAVYAIEQYYREM